MARSRSAHAFTPPQSPRTPYVNAYCCAFFCPLRTSTRKSGFIPEYTTPAKRAGGRGGEGAIAWVRGHARACNNLTPLTSTRCTLHCRTDVGGEELDLLDRRLVDENGRQLLLGGNDYAVRGCRGARKERNEGARVAVDGKRKRARTQPRQAPAQHGTPFRNVSHATAPHSTGSGAANAPARRRHRTHPGCPETSCRPAPPLARARFGAACPTAKTSSARTSSPPPPSWPPSRC